MRENGLSVTIWPRRNAKEVFFLMKKINQTLAALLLVLTACAPGLASPLGVRVAIPEGWKCVQDEQVLIYNRSETAAVIIDQVGKNNGESAESVASSLADAVEERPRGGIFENTLTAKSPPSRVTTQGTSLSDTSVSSSSGL